MNEIKPGDGAHGSPHRDNLHPVVHPYWKRAHRDWRVWIAAAFIFVAMVIYVLTVEFTVEPPSLSRPPASIAGKSPVP